MILLVGVGVGLSGRSWKDCLSSSGIHHLKRSPRFLILLASLERGESVSEEVASEGDQFGASLSSGRDVDSEVPTRLLGAGMLDKFAGTG